MISSHRRELIMHWQRTHGLVVDGVYGPITEASLDLAVGEAPVLGIMQLLAVEALRHVGRGETGTSNYSAFIEIMNQTCGWEGTSGAWCAKFISFCLHNVCFSRGISLPCALSRGARKLGKNIAKEGIKLDMYETADTLEYHPVVGVWHRDGLPWNRHVRLITAYHPADDSIDYIAGNERGKVVHVARYKNWRKGYDFGAAL